MNKINIAIALNRAVLYPAYVMLRSLAKNHASGQLCVYVLHSVLNEEDCCFFRDALLRGREDNQMIFLRIDPVKTAGLPYNHLWSTEMYYRLMLPELLGESIDRILYLDIDMIVNKDITEFYSTDFDDCLLIAARDMEFDTILAMDEPDSRLRNAFFKELVENGMTYFCSGVLLMNLSRLRERYSFEKYIEIFHSIADKVILPDQDLLNYVHNGQVKYVDECQYGLFAQTAHKMGMTYDDVSRNVSILHFTGQAKPWTTNLVRYDIEKIWWEYAKDTPFYAKLLEAVFYQSMESHFAEDKIHELMAENNELRGLLHKCRSVIQRISG